MNFTGELLFEKNSGVALKAISVKGSFCVSLGEVTNTVDLGKLGYGNFFFKNILSYSVY